MVLSDIPHLPRAALALAALLLAGCAVGPDYVRPQLDVPAAFKETGGPWKTAAPQTIDADHPWWDAYGDSTLSALIVQANAANQNIRVAEAQYRQAQAITAAARAGFFPSVGLNAGATRAQTNSTGTVKLGTTDTLGLGASWEPDIWGAVRRSVEAGNAGAQA
ncbi:TolC family protein, partial [Variovorax sp. Varisp62]|uniref:TolC family protein n=1 Tax=Variovorax sp. Varisp62 TaxID=3243049 RepID=UPI0039B54E4C